MQNGDGLNDRQSNGTGGGYGGGDDRRGGFGGRDRGFGADRPKFAATCTKCGKETTVPFQPTAGRPVYCFECFKEMRQDRPPRRNFGGPRREF